MSSSQAPGWLAAASTLAHTLLGAELGVDAGWPQRGRHTETAQTPGWTWLHLESSQMPNHRPALRIDTGLALQLVGRTLGAGEADCPGAHPGAELSDIERGVLAYTMARMLNACGGHFQLRDVDRSAPKDVDGQWVCWPWAVRLGPYHSAAQWWAPPVAPGQEPPGSRLPCHWILTSEARDPSPLRTGQVWILDHQTSPVRGWLRLSHFASVWPARLESGELQARNSPAPVPEHASVEIPGPALLLSELAALHAGEPVRWSPNDTGTELWEDGRQLATGELVLLGPALGLLVS